MTDSDPEQFVLSGGAAAGGPWTELVVQKTDLKTPEERKTFTNWISLATPIASSLNLSSCADRNSNWTDDNANNCSVFSGLNGGRQCALYGDEDKGLGRASDACCACGGGGIVGCDSMPAVDKEYCHCSCGPFAECALQKQKHYNVPACWSIQKAAASLGLQASNSTECYDLDVAKQRCLLAENCNSVIQIAQNNSCTGKYQLELIHGTTLLTTACLSDTSALLP